MSWEGLKSAINAKAKSRIAETEAKYERELSLVTTKLKAEARQAEEEILAQAEADGELAGRRAAQEQQLSGKALVLEAKALALQKVADAALAEINAWPPSESEAWLKGLLDNLPETPGKIKAGALHADVLKKLVKETPHELQDKQIPDEGGFIFSGQESEINATTSQLVKQTMQKNRTEIANTLFGS